MFMSMGIPPDSVGGEGLGRMEGRAIEGGQSTKKGVNRGKAEHVGVKVVEWSMDWKASFANHTWSILWTAAYQASRSVSAGHPKGIVAI